MAGEQVEVPEGLIGAAGAESMRRHHFRPNDEITRTIIEFAYKHFCDRLLDDEVLKAARAAEARWHRADAPDTEAISLVEYVLRSALQATSIPEVDRG